jgi:hypothetical protein
VSYVVASGIRNRRKFDRRAILVVLAAMTLSGCSGSPHPSSPTSSTATRDNTKLAAVDVISTVKPVMQAVPGFELGGEGPDSTGGDGYVDVKYGLDGSTGYVTVGNDKVQLLQVGSTLYLSSTQDFWSPILATDKLTTPTAASLAGKWVEVPAANSQFAGLAAIADRTQMLDQLLPADTLTAEGPRQWQGASVVAFLSQKDSTFVYVAAKGLPYLLGTSTPTDSEGGTASGAVLGNFNLKVSVSAPASTDVIDLTKYVK